MPEAVLIAGANGAGKTTFARWQINGIGIAGMDKTTPSTRPPKPEPDLREPIRRALDAARRDARSADPRKRAGQYAPAPTAAE